MSVISIHLADSRGIQLANEFVKQGGSGAFKQVLSGSISDFYDEECYLLNLNAEAVGFAVIRGATAESEHQTEIFRFFVSERARGRGVGRSAALQILQMLKRRGRKQVMLEIESDEAFSFWKATLSGLDVELRGDRHYVNLNSV
ncbi:GNAT family N-acetyltransferase [Aquipseudomonas alcaligenes]